MITNILCSNNFDLKEYDNIDDMKFFATQGLIAESEEPQDNASFCFYNSDYDYDNQDNFNQEYYPH